MSQDKYMKTLWWGVVGIFILATIFAGALYFTEDVMAQPDRTVKKNLTVEKKYSLQELKTKLSQKAQQFVGGLSAKQKQRLGKWVLSQREQGVALKAVYAKAQVRAKKKLALHGAVAALPDGATKIVRPVRVLSERKVVR